VAAELVVTVKAVEFHLGHVFDKLGVRSRRALPGLLAAGGPEPGAATVAAARV
jgi:DNA-binding CsgD family transcriptional regulator